MLCQHAAQPAAPCCNCLLHSPHPARPCVRAQGPLVFNGTFHLFFQHLPNSAKWDWGLVWGHALSKVSASGAWR